MLDEYQKLELQNKGYVHLEQLQVTKEFKETAINKSTSLNDRYYNEGMDIHNEYYENYNLQELTKDLINIARDMYGYKCDINDIYKITRIVGDKVSSEHYRFHFDSHLFTLVTPIYLPETNSNHNGELILFPNVRKNPKLEIINICQKIYFKQFSGEDGFRRLSKKYIPHEFNFQNSVPLLFLGRECLHGNHPFKSEKKRITMLTHFFDPSGNFSIGNILRKIRNR